MSNFFNSVVFYLNNAKSQENISRNTFHIEQRAYKLITFMAITITSIIIIIIKYMIICVPMTAFVQTVLI